MKTQIIISIFFLLTSLLSCGQGKIKLDDNTITIKAKDKHSIALTFILNYYENKYKTEKITKSENDSILEFGAFSSENAAIGNNHSIPKYDYILGDLNNDNKDDIIVSVTSTAGGSAEWQEIFLFITNTDTILFNKVYRSFELANCPETGGMDGQFYPNGIENNQLLGTSICYKEDDAHCCPSISKKTICKYNGILTVLQ